MYSQDEIRTIIARLTQSLSALFPHDRLEAILFGSYARGSADDTSDIDVLFLVDSPRQIIAQKNWQVGEAAAELLLEYGVMISPLVENRDYYHAHANLLPLFKNIERQGVAIGA